MILYSPIQNRFCTTYSIGLLFIKHMLLSACHLSHKPICLEHTPWRGVRQLPREQHPSPLRYCGCIKVLHWESIGGGHNGLIGMHECEPACDKVPCLCGCIHFYGEQTGCKVLNSLLVILEHT